MEQKHILFVDNENHLLEPMKYILANNNFSASVSTNGIHALKIYNDSLNSVKPVDLLITNIQLNKMDGLELVDEIRRTNLHLPILLTTNYSDKQLLNKIIDKGCWGYIEKPINADQIIDYINRIFKKEERLLSQLSQHLK